MDELHSRQKHHILEVARAFLRGQKDVSALGILVSSVSFLVGVLRDQGDTLPENIEEELATLEEIYGVALDREWQELPAEERDLVTTAVEFIRDRADASS